jgi:hypothetical protein
MADRDRLTIATSILSDYAEAATVPLDTIAKRHGVTASALRRWATEDAAIGALYARARSVSAGGLEDAAVAVANASTAESYQADRVKIDTYKWAAAKRHPKEYGDKATVEHTGSQALTVRVVRDGQADAAQAIAAPTVTATARLAAADAPLLQPS